MKRIAALNLLLLLAILLPVCALAENGYADSLGVGETRSYPGWHRYNYSLATESLTPDIISVSFDTATALSPGTGIIRCTYSKPDLVTAITEDVQIKVCPAPDSVAFNESDLKLGLGEIYRLSAILPEGTSGRVVFASNNLNIGIDQQGMDVHIFPHQLGTWNVTVETYNNKSAVCQLEVVPGPTEVSLSPTSLTMFTGQTYALTASYSGGYTRKGVQYSSVTPSLCSVSSDGVVTALASGSAAVLAQTYNGPFQYCFITVCDSSEPDTISLSGIQSRVGAGDTFAFIPRDSAGNPLSLMLTFSDSTVLTPFVGNRLKALKEGVCTVTASSPTQSASKEITVLPAPASLELSPAEVSMKELETVVLTPILPEGTVSGIEYSTSNYMVATVSADGVITAHKPGSANITARTYNDRYAICRVTVVPSEITYTLSPQTAEVGMYKTLQLSLTDPNGNTVPAAYTSSSPQVATVDASGLVTGQETGYAEITAAVADGRTYTAQIRVIVIPEYITVTPTEMVLRVGQTGYFYVNNDITTCYDFSVVSSDPSVALITPASGASVEAVGVGTATLTITSSNGKTATLFIAVLPMENVLVPGVGTQISLGAGQKKNMDVRDIFGNPVSCTYTSSDIKSARVNSKGDITGVYKYMGSSIITATARDGRTCTTRVDIYPAPGYLRLNTDALNVPVGDTFQLVPSVQMGSCAFDITYRTSKSGVATVSPDGLITARGAGSCTVTARTYNGKSAKVAVMVGSAPTSVTVSPSQMHLGLEESRKLSITLSRGSAGLYSFLTEDPSIVSTYDGVVKGLRLGSTRITVRTYNGVTGTCDVTVGNAPESLTLQSPLGILGIKQSAQLQACLTPGSHSAITYTSSNPKVATVSGGGLVTGIKVGSVTITARTYNGLSASVTLQVKKAPSSVKLSTRSAKLTVGEQLKLAVTLSAGSEGTYTFSSRNSVVATVDQNGLVTAINPGRTTITVLTYNGKKTTCTVSVFPPP